MNQSVKSILWKILKILGYALLIIFIIVVFLILKMRSDPRNSPLYDSIPDINFQQITVPKD